MVYVDGDKRYILAPISLEIGMTVSSGTDVEYQVGNCLPLERIPLGTLVHNVEMTPGKGGKIARSAGNSTDGSTDDCSAFFVSIALSFRVSQSTISKGKPCPSTTRSVCLLSRTLDPGALVHVSWCRRSDRFGESLPYSRDPGIRPRANRTAHHMANGATEGNPAK